MDLTSANGHGRDESWRGPPEEGPTDGSRGRSARRAQGSAPADAPRWSDFVEAEHELFRIAFARRFGGVDADELVQEVFLHFLAHQDRLPALDATRAPRRYVMTQAHWQASRARRARRAASPLATLDELGLLVARDERDRHDVREVLERALAEVPRDQALLVRQRYLEGATPGELALEHELPIGTVHSRVFRGLAHMKRALEAQGTVEHLGLGRLGRLGRPGRPGRDARRGRAHALVALQLRLARLVRPSSWLAVAAGIGGLALLNAVHVAPAASPAPRRPVPVPAVPAPVPAPLDQDAWIDPSDLAFVRRAASVRCHDIQGPAQAPMDGCPVESVEWRRAVPPFEDAPDVQRGAGRAMAQP